MDVMSVAAGYNALVAQQANVDVSTAILAKTLQVQQSNAVALLQAMAPTGPLGQNVDLRA
jgi:hypothetical protein